MKTEVVLKLLLNAESFPLPLGFNENRGCIEIIFSLYFLCIFHCLMKTEVVLKFYITSLFKVMLSRLMKTDVVLKYADTSFNN